MSVIVQTLFVLVVSVYYDSVDLMFVLYSGGLNLFIPCC